MSIIEYLSHPLWQRLAMTLIHFLWQGLVIMLLLMSLTSVFKTKHGNARYGVYLTGFMVMILCPVITFIALDSHTEAITPPQITISENKTIETEFTEPIYVESTTTPPHVDLPKTENIIPAHTQNNNIQTTTTNKHITQNYKASGQKHSLLPWFTAAWITGVFILSIRLFVGFIGVYRCRRNCKPLPERLSNSVKLLSNKMGIKDFSRVFISNRIVHAIAIGYIRPMILLPASMLTQLTPDMLEAVIAHELAHIRRFDLWINLLQRIAETLLFYHPAIWWISGVIRTEREYCCDELAVKVTGHRLNYAAALESAGRISIMPKHLALAEGLSRDKNTLLRRVQYILGLKPVHKNNSSWITSVITISLISLIIISSALCFTEKASGDSDTDENVPEYVQEIETVIYNWLDTCKKRNIEEAKTLLREKESAEPESLMQLGILISDSLGDEQIIPVKVAKIESDKTNGAFFIATTEKGYLFNFNGSLSYLASFVHKVDNKWLIESVTYSDQETADRTFESIQKDYPDNYTIWEKESYTTLGETKNKILREKLKTFEQNKWNQLDNAPKEAKDIAGIVRKWVIAGLSNDQETFNKLYTAEGKQYVEENLKELQQRACAIPEWQFSPMIIKISESMAQILTHYFYMKSPIPDYYDDSQVAVFIRTEKVDGKWGIFAFTHTDIRNFWDINISSQDPNAQIWIDESTPEWLNPLIKSNIESFETIIETISKNTVNGLDEKLRKELGEMEIFESYFPDSIEGGKVLDEWWPKRENDPEADKKIFEIVRNGLRKDGNGNERKIINQYIGDIGSKYILKSEEQNKDAIDLVYYASYNPKLAGSAVYNGLSPIKEKSDKIIKRLVELCMEDVSVSRILSETKENRQDMLVYLKPYLESNSPEIKERAKVLEGVFKGEIDYGKWSDEQLVKRLRDGLGDKLDEIKETLLNGPSVQRKDILGLIRRYRLNLLFNSSFEKPLQACVTDNNPDVKEYAFNLYMALLSKSGEYTDEILDIMETLSKDNNRNIREEIARFVGNKWVWGVNPQNSKAIDIIYRLSSDKVRDVRDKAIYFGLSVVANKNEKIIKRLVELAMDKSNDLGRIAWGLSNGADMQIIKNILIPYLEPENENFQQAALLYKELFKVDPPGTNKEETSENETSLLTELINSAEEGAFISLPKGTYKVPVSINKSITLIGQSKDDCIIEITKNGPAILVDTKGVGKVRLENLTIKWQLATSDQCESPYAVCIKDSEAYISNCSFVPLGNYQRSPVALRASGFSNMNVNNCKFEGYNYTVQYGEGTEGAFSNSIVTNSGHQGVTLYAGAKAAISGNIITGSKYHGLRSTGGEFDVRNNLIINNDNRGIYLGNKSSSGTIVNNVIIGNGSGISSFAQTGVAILNNVIADNGYSGIDMRDSCKLSIRDNIIKGNERGLALFEESGTNNNKIYKNTFWQNKAEAENIDIAKDSIIADPLFKDANNGDFSLKSGQVLDAKQGLENHEIFIDLWKRWKNREDNSGQQKLQSTSISEVPVEEGTDLTFESYFPDDIEAGKKLDEWWEKKSSMSLDDDTFFELFRNGIRRCSVKSKDNYLMQYIGSNYVWHKQPNSQKALDIIYHASFSDDYKYYAVYSGLSVANPKSEKVLKRLVDIAIEPHQLGRIIWGVRSSKQEDEFAKLLELYIESSDQIKSEHAEKVLLALKGELDADALERELNQQLKAERTISEFGNDLPRLKQTLLNGTSAERLEAFNFLISNTVSLTHDESFIDALTACTKDSDPEVRSQAVKRLGTYYVLKVNPPNQQAIDVLTELLKDPDHSVRYAAVCYGLSTLPDPDKEFIGKMIQTILDDREVNYYGRVIQSLRRNNKEACIEILKEWMDNFEQDNQKAVKAYEIYEDVTDDFLPEEYAQRFAGKKSNAHEGLVAVCFKNESININIEQLQKQFIKCLADDNLLQKVKDFYILEKNGDAGGLFICDNLSDRNAIRQALMDNGEFSVIGYNHGAIGPTGSGWIDSLDNFKNSYLDYFKNSFNSYRVELSTVSLDTNAPTDEIILQQMIDSAEPESTVVIPNGTYTKPVEITKPLTLKGQSRTGCILEVTADKPAIFIDAKTKGKVEIQDITIKWQLATSDRGEHRYALGIKDTVAEIRNCIFEPLGNFQRCPVAINSLGFSELNINMCRFEGYEYTVCFGEGTKGAIQNSLVMDSGHQGISLYAGADVRIIDNVVTGSKYHGVRSTGGTLYMKDNLIINNDNRGVYLGNKPASGTIENNVIIGNGSGISGFAQTSVAIQNNVIVDNGYSGIDMRDSCKLSIRDNIIKGNELGLVLFEEIGRNTNEILRNTFWQNKAESENIDIAKDSIIADPLFKDANNGDFSLKAGQVLDAKQGLENHEIFIDLWKRWENREDKKTISGETGSTSSNKGTIENSQSKIKLCLIDDELKEEINIPSFKKSVDEIKNVYIQKKVLFDETDIIKAELPKSGEKIDSVILYLTKDAKKRLNAIMLDDPGKKLAFILKQLEIGFVFEATSSGTLVMKFKEVLCDEEYTKAVKLDESLEKEVIEPVFNQINAFLMNSN